MAMHQLQIAKNGKRLDLKALFRHHENCAKWQVTILESRWDKKVIEGIIPHPTSTVTGHIYLYISNIINSTKL